VLVDPTEIQRAKNMLGSDVDHLVAPVDEFWVRDHGPSFVVDAGRLGAVSWTFNGWGANDWAEWEKSSQHGRIIAEYAGAELITSSMVNEGGGIHVDGQGTVLLTETVQLDTRRNPGATKAQVEAELERTIGASNFVWVPRGLAADYEEFGTNGHIDIIATIAAPGTVLMHTQANEHHPDFAVVPLIREALAAAHDAEGHAFEIIEVPGPETVRSGGELVDWSYINHLAVNGGVIACGFGDPYADDRARDILGAAYGRDVVSIDARPFFARGGGVHCITQQQPAL
ncbi:MAG: agmatine deiminase family protein, partial [Microbacteriaceae bacterium]